MKQTPKNRPDLRVLLIDDDEDDFVLVRDLLEHFRESIPHLEWISDPDLGLQVAMEDCHDVILVDYRLGRWSGLELIAKMSENGGRKPSILLTGEERENLDIEALQKGAADYLAKSEINPQLLERSIRYAIERKRAEEALRESEKRFRTLADAVPVHIWMNNGSPFTNTFLNQHWLDFRGKTLEEELPDGWMSGVHPDDLDRLIRLAEEAMAKKEPFETEIRLLRKDGEYRWMLTTATCLEFANGTFNGYVGTCVDITERKTSAEHLARARDEALELAQLKSQFLANMTHEIRTPMNGILGMTGLLQQTNLSEEQHDLTESVRSSGQALLRIIDDILDFSRLEAGKLQIDRTPFNLLTVLEDVIELLAEAARIRNIELIAFIDPRHPLALIGDPGRLRQILLNLVGNSIKFTHEGEVHLHVRLLQEERKKVRLLFEIRDTGVGMSADTREKLFAPFMQADGSTTRTYGGTGLGLAICKELIELMNGEISVASELGHGSTFQVQLDFSKDLEDDLFLESGEPEWKGRKILVVDDNSEQRAHLCRHFTALGFDCVELSHPSKAPHILAHESHHGEPFAAIFIEADQDPKKAAEMIAHISNFPGCEETAIVAMPYESLNEELEPLRKAGADFFLSKPIRQSHIYPLFKSLLSNQKKNAETKPADSSESLKRYRFLVISDREGKSDALEQLLTYLGESADLVTSGKQALESLGLFHYDTTFLDYRMRNEDPEQLRKQIESIPPGSNPASKIIISFGDHSCPRSHYCLIEPFDATDVINVLRSSGLITKTDPVIEPAPEEESAAPAHKILDSGRLQEILHLESDGENVIADLLDLFRQEVPPRMADLQKAIEMDQKQEIRFLTHAISGICANLGAAHIEDLCGELKTYADEGDRRRTEELLRTIETEIDTIEQALQDACESISPRKI